MNIIKDDIGELIEIKMIEEGNPTSHIVLEDHPSHYGGLLTVDRYMYVDNKFIIKKYFLRIVESGSPDSIQIETLL